MNRKFIYAARQAFLLGAALIIAPKLSAVNYEVYPGSAFYLTQMVDSVSYPYVAQFANGFYYHPVGFGSSSDTVLTTQQKQQICNNFSNRFAMVEGDMGSGNPSSDVGDINTISGFGLTPIATFVNRPAATPIWQQLVAINGALNTPSYEMTAPWGVAAQPGGWTNSTWDYLRSNILVSGCSGIGIDSPVNLYRSGYTVGNPAYQQAVWQMTQYAQAHGKRFNYLASPNTDTAQQFLLDMQYVAQSLEDNGAEPNVYGVELYGTEPVNLTPETTNYSGVVQANWTTTGLAYYLLKHRDGEPGTLDLYATSNSVNYAKSVMSPVLNNAAQIIPFDPNKTNTFTLTLTNNSPWLDYAAVLRARTRQSANWNITFKIGTTNITSSVLNSNGYVFLGSQRLFTNTAQQVTVTVGPNGAPTPLDLVIEALPHVGVDQALDVIAFQYQTNQSPPTLNFPTNDWFTRSGLATAPIWFTVGDAETFSTNLTVTAVSSNTTLVPNANITLGQSGVQRWINISPAPNQWGVAPITLSVSDGQFSVSNTFNVFVQQTNILPFVKANNTVNLEITNSWTTNVTPDGYGLAIWNSTVTAANTVTLGASADWSGIQITTPGGAVTINGTNTLTLETSGVDLSAASQNLTINCPLVLNASEIWNIASGKSATVNGNISGYGALTKSGLGTLTLTGTNTYTSGTTITSSYGATNSLLVSNSLTLGTGAISIGGSGNTDGCCLKLAGGITLSNTLNGWASRSVASPNLLNVSGTNTVISSITGTSGGSQSTLQSDSGNLVMLGTITTRQLNLQGAGSGELRGAVNIAAYNLVMNGPGQWTLSGTNTYTGGTIVNGGTLLVNGRNLGGETVSVNSGGKLGGRGILTGPVTVASGATLAPGAGIGILTISNSLTASAGSTNFFELNKAANTNDSVRGLSAVIFGGTLQLTNFSGTLATNDVFKLFYSSSYSGTFSALSPPFPVAGLRWNTNTLAMDGTIRITNAPTARLLGASLRGTNLLINATNGSPGIVVYLQATTNLAAPSLWPRVATNYFDGTGAVIWTNAAVQKSPTSFFRLEAP
jgi:autotransporter-associated beta strand protein